MFKKLKEIIDRIRELRDVEGLYYIVEHWHDGGSVWKAHPAQAWPDAPWDEYRYITSSFSFSEHGGSADQCEQKLREYLTTKPMFDALKFEPRVVRVVRIR